VLSFATLLPFSELENETSFKNNTRHLAANHVASKNNAFIVEQLLVKTHKEFFQALSTKRLVAK